MPEVKTDFSSYLNSDSAPHKLLPTEYVNLQNMRIGDTTDKGRTQQLESIGATVELVNPYLANEATLSLGSAEDVARQRKLNFVWSPSNLHAIYCDDGITVYKVLLEAQCEQGLGFDKDYLIDAKIEGDLVFYVDGKGESKCFNIEAGIKLNQSGYATNQAPYATPVKYTTTTLIKRPPIFPPTIIKGNDNTFANNFIQLNAYQFTYRYRYRDNQTSALSAFSDLVPYNFNTDTSSNVIGVKMPFTEYIDDDIFAVDLCYKAGNFGKTFVIKTWDKASDATAIADHNAGTTALTYNFYDDRKGQQLNDVEAANNLDPIPIVSQTLEFAKNRCFLGNNLLGYNTPTSTSLATTVVISGTGGSSLSAVWGYVTLHANFSAPGGCADPFMYPFAFVASTGNFYYFPSVRVNTIWNGGEYPADLPSTIDILSSTATGSTEAGFVTTLKFSTGTPPTSGCTFSSPQWQTTYSVSYTIFGTTYPVSLLAAAAGSAGFFKSASTYDVTIAFYDRYRRKCGVVKKYQVNNIPARTYTQTSFASVIQWTLSNTAAAAEIPDWAYYYQIHISRNDTIQSFVQIRTTGAGYIVRMQNGAFTYPTTTSTYSFANTYAIAFDTSNLLPYGLGYAFTQGDYIRIGKSDNTNTLLRVLGTDGNYVFAAPYDLGSLDINATTGTTVLVELYTPYKPSTNELFYETGMVYPVTAPGKSTRAYSTVAGTLTGDAYSIERKLVTTLYVVEAMSPNDKVWQSWQTDTGWPNAVDIIGQQTLTGNIVFSDVFIQGTKVNGLSKFQPLNSADLSLEDGKLRKLKLTSKTQAEGTVMLAICESQTLSLYIGESILTSSTGVATAIAKSDGVIAQINPLKGSWGTIHPESVIEFKGEVFWFDALQGEFVFYSVNGLHSLSEKKLSRFAKLFANKFKSMTKDAIRALGNVPFIVGGINIHHKEIMWSIPKLGANPNGTLVDTGMDYPYDFYDQQAKTVIFKLGALNQEGRFMGSFDYYAESFRNVGDNSYYFKAGKIYLMDQVDTGYNTFAGVNYKARIMYALNASQSVPAIAGSVAVESNVPPTYMHFRTEYPYIQSSDLVAADFATLEGINYADIYRDRLSPNASGSYDSKLYSGDKMRATFIYQLIEFAINNAPVQLKASNTLFELSSGHKV